MVMEATSMDLKVISGKDLKAFNFFQKLTLYALVLIVSDDPQKELDKKEKQQQRTPTDRDEDGDGSNPEWNHEMRFDLELISSHDYENLFVLFELRHEGLVFGDKTIGEVRVPLKDLIQEPNNGVVRFVTYEVRTSDGKPNGSLKFSYRVNGKGSGAYTYSSQFPETNMNITGYSFLEAHQSPKIQYPNLEIGSSSPGLSYPSLDSPLDSPQIPGFHASPPAPPHSYPPNPYPPPAAFYLQPPPPQPFSPPAPMAHGIGHGYEYYSPFEPRVDPWTSDPNFQQAWRW